MLIPVLQEHCRPKEAERISFRSAESGISERILAISGVSQRRNRYSILGRSRNSTEQLQFRPGDSTQDGTRGSHCLHQRQEDCACDRDSVTGEVYRSSKAHFAAAVIILNEEEDATLFTENRFTQSSMFAPDSPGSRGSGGSIGTRGA